MKTKYDKRSESRVVWASNPDWQDNDSREHIKEKSKNDYEELKIEASKSRDNCFNYGIFGTAFTGVAGLFGYLGRNPEVVDKMNHYFFGPNSEYNSVTFAAVAAGLAAVGFGVTAVRSHFKAKSLDNFAEETTRD